jgi:hypothetical protein
VAGLVGAVAGFGESALEGGELPFLFFDVGGELFEEDLAEVAAGETVYLAGVAEADAGERGGGAVEGVGAVGVEFAEEAEVVGVLFAEHAGAVEVLLDFGELFVGGVGFVGG